MLVDAIGSGPFERPSEECCAGHSRMTAPGTSSIASIAHRPLYTHGRADVNKKRRTRGRAPGNLRTCAAPSVDHGIFDSTVNNGVCFCSRGRKLIAGCLRFRPWLTLFFLALSSRCVIFVREFPLSAALSRHLSFAPREWGTTAH